MISVECRDSVNFEQFFFIEPEVPLSIVRVVTKDFVNESGAGSVRAVRRNLFPLKTPG